MLVFVSEYFLLPSEMYYNFSSWKEASYNIKWNYGKRFEYILILHVYYHVGSCGKQTWNSLGWMFAQWRLWGLIVDLVHMWLFNEAGILVFSLS